MGWAGVRAGGPGTLRCVGERWLGRARVEAPHGSRETVPSLRVARLRPARCLRALSKAAPRGRVQGGARGRIAGLGNPPRRTELRSSPRSAQQRTGEEEATRLCRVSAYAGGFVLAESSLIYQRHTRNGRPEAEARQIQAGSNETLFVLP